MKAWLSLGSNLEDPIRQIERAYQFLREKCYLTLLRASDVITTKPYGYSDQPDFMNQVVEVETLLSPEELLSFIKNAEVELGRRPTFKWGPRRIDIDILFCDDLIIKSPDLTVPHPGTANREYLLQLLDSIIPEYVHPELNCTIHALYENIKYQGEKNV